MCRSGQHRFMKGRYCLLHLRSLYDKVTSLVDEGKAVNVVCVEIIKGFDTFPRRTFLENCFSMVWMGVACAG